MKRGLALLLCAAAVAVPLHAAQRTGPSLEAQLLAHISVLASDAYGGRQPGTECEIKTLRYIARQLAESGLVSGTNEPGNPWFAPVTLVAREPAATLAQFSRRGHLVPLSSSQIFVVTSGRRTLLRSAPLLFVGKATEPLPPRNELAGRVAVLLGGEKEGSERQNALLAAGAAAVLTVLDGPRTLDAVAARRKRSGYALAGEALGGDLEAFISKTGMDRVLAGSGGSVAALQREAAAADFAPRTLDLRVSLEASTNETTIHTHNLIAKLPGRRPQSGVVLYVAHWDHFGQCATPPAEHLICNGAIDNASGVAALIEIARRLAQGRPLDRDVYFLATTGEELGLLGAKAFAEDPPVPLKQIVAAFNIDSIAIAPAGTPLAIVGKGMTGLDPQIAQVAKRQKRVLLDSTAGNAYVRRQDGWALLQHDIPTVMVTSAYGDIRRLERFFESDYHRPGDRVKPGLELGGAAEDVTFLVALGRWFGDSRRVKLPAAS
jgi:hypothetical protein